MFIRSETEGRVFECALQFAVYERALTYPFDNVLYAASFVGRPSPAKAIAAGMASSFQRWFTIVAEEKVRAACHSARLVVDRVGDVLHVLALPKQDSPIIIAPDGDLDRALTAWVCSRYAVPPEFDYREVFRLEELTVLKDPVCAWGNLRAWRVDGLKHRPSWDRELDEALLLEGIEIALKEKRLLIPPSPVEGRFDPEMTLQEYLKANARVFAERLSHVRPLHNSNKLHPAIVMERVPFPAQAHAVQGLVEALKRNRLALACGDMGTGKSIIALGVCNVLHHKKQSTRILISAPGITIPKWDQQEIKDTLPGADVTVIRSTDDAARYLRIAREGKLPEGLSFVLVGIDRAKLGPDPWCAALWRPVREIEEGKASLKGWAWHCPSCGKFIPDPRLSREGEEVPAGWTLFAAEPLKKDMFNANGMAKRKIRWALPPKLRKCPRCNSLLWRPALKSRSETPNRPRWYVADILKRLGKHFDLYVADEVHQTKAQDSGRGYAFAQMVRCAKKTLALTGTLLNGMSTSIKEILWRTDPASLLKLGFDHKTGMVQWASRYGVLERVIRISDEDEGIVTRRKKVQKQPREKPGIAPELVATHLLHRAVFLELQDLGLPVVDLKEIPVFVELDEEHREEYQRFHSRLLNVCRAAYAAGNKGAFARFIPATINAVDRADLDSVVEVGGEEIRFFGFPAYYNAKERELVRIVQENLDENRGCIVYTFYTDRYNVHSRLQKVLRDHGIEAEVLESHVSPEARFEYLHEAEKRGVKVIICNLRLVEVGLDLIAWPTLIFYQMSYDINSVRQASRRAWRIGQARECRVYYLVANGTQQVAQFEACMVKRAHAMLAEGRLDRSELSKYGRDQTSALAADLARCLADEDLGAKWTELALKDLEVETVSEKEFQKVLQEAQERLARETLRLCGQEVEAEAETEKTEAPAWTEFRLVPKRRRKQKILPGQMTIFDLLGGKATCS